MYLSKCFHMPTKNFLRFSLMAIRLNSKQILENCTVQTMSTVTYELSPYHQEIEKSLDEPDSPLRWKIREPIEKGCSAVLEGMRFDTNNSSDYRFYSMLRKKCRTIADGEDRRDTIKCLMKSNIKWCGETLACEVYHRRGLKGSDFSVNCDLSNPLFWQSALINSREKPFVELKKKLKKLKFRFVI